MKTKSALPTALIIIMIIGLIAFGLGSSGAAGKLSTWLNPNSLTSGAFSNGFENGFGSWTSTSGSPITVSSPVYQGILSAQFVSGSTTSCAVEDGSGASAIEFALYVPSAYVPNSNVWSDVNFLTVFQSDWATNIGLQFFSDGNGQPCGFEVEAVDSSGTILFHSYAYNIQGNTWYTIDLVTSYASNGGYSLYVNDQLLGSASANLAGLSSARFYVGSIWGSEATYYIDSVSIGTGYTPSNGATPTPTPISTPTPTPTPIGAAPTPTPVALQTVYLTMGYTGQGSIFPSTGVYPYSSGSGITITANPATGYVFSYWLFDDNTTSTQSPYNMHLDKNRSALAVFAPSTPNPSPTPAPTPIPTKEPTGGQTNNRVDEAAQVGGLATFLVSGLCFVAVKKPKLFK